MRKFSLLPILCPLLLCGLTFQASAQEEIPYFHNLLQHAPQHQLIKPKPTLASSERTTSDPCNVSANGDFEAQLQTPNHLNNVGGGAGYSGTGATNRPDQLADWYSPTGGSPDYWAANATTPTNPSSDPIYPGADMRPSQAIYGPFSPRSSDGAVGLYYRATSDMAAEYVRATIPVLTRDAKYYAEFWVSLSQNKNICAAGIKEGFGFVLGMVGKTVSRDYLAVPSTATALLSGRLDQNAINYGPSGNGNWKRVSRQFTGKEETTITFGLFSNSVNGDPSNFEPLPNTSFATSTYLFLDDVAIYKIPTAGPSVSTPCPASFQLGEGCDIPGATYSWKITGSNIVLPNTLQITVSPSSTTTYTQTVTLPDKSISTSSATVTVTAKPTEAPSSVGLVEVHNSFFSSKVYNVVVNNGAATSDNTIILDVYNAYDPSTRISHYSRSPYTGPTTTSPQEETQGYTTFATGFVGPGASYILVATVVGPCGSASTTQTVTLPANGEEGDEPYIVAPGGSLEQLSTPTAYPNPASESLTLPTGVKEAVLLDNQGGRVRQLENSGKLDVRKLPDGIYNLQIRHKGKIINQRIQVKH
jgi:hypothetical protein